MFPGQGSQVIGMGQDFYNHASEARETFEEASTILKTDLAELCFSGTEEELCLTVNAQPAILTTSIAIYRVFRQHVPPPAALAGHSLGEFSALVAAEALQFPDALRIVRLRGEWMEEAMPAGKGGMSAVIGASAEEVQRICESIEGPVQVANYNSPRQVVISGALDCLARAENRLKEKKGVRILPLKVSGPFHTDLMESAARGFEEALLEIDIREPRYPFYANVSGSKEQDPHRIRNLLIRQVTQPVLWQRSMEKMYQDGLTLFFTLGEGKALCRFAKSIDDSVEARQISTYQEMEINRDLLEAKMRGIS